MSSSADPDEFSPFVREAWAVFECFRRLGFSADDIFIEVCNTVNAAPAPGLALNVILRTQGRTCTITCSTKLTELAAQDLLAQVRKFLPVTQFPEKRLKEILYGSFVWANKVELVTMLSHKGFTFPYKLES